MRRVAVVHSGLAGPVAGGGTRGAVVEVVGQRDLLANSLQDWQVIPRSFW